MSDLLEIISDVELRPGLVQHDGNEVMLSEARGAGEFAQQLYDFLQPDYPRFFKMDLLSKLGWLGAELLLQGKEIKTVYAANRIAVLLSNSSASLDTDTKYYSTVSELASPALFVYTLPNIVIGEICIRNGFKGEQAFFISDGFDEKFLLGRAESLARLGRIDVCIFGWVELSGNEFLVKLKLATRLNR